MSFRITLLTSMLFFCGQLCPAMDHLKRTDFFVESDLGTKIFVRQVAPSSANVKSAPVLLIHGARVPGIASFDLPVEGGSLAADLAKDGRDVYLMDIRGYGRSTRGPEFSQPAAAHDPLVRSNEAIRDIAAVVQEIRKRHPESKPALLGWATGGHWAGYYASLHSDQLSGLILLNTIYGVDAPQDFIGRGSTLEDPKHPGHFNYTAVRGYRCNLEESLLGGWDNSIPVQDKAEWRDPQVANAYVNAAMESDPESAEQDPPCFRSPNGALEDTFYLATGRQFWDASLITVPVLVVAGERDFWSRKEDRDELREHLVHSPKVQVIVVPDATHFLFLDRPERGRSAFLQTVREFLSQRAE